MRLSLLTAAALVGAPLAAQPPTQSAVPALRYGILAGLSSATLNFGDALDGEGEAADFDFGRRNGLLAGAYLAVPVGAGSFALRPELLYVQKGGSFSTSFELDDATAADLDATIRLTYVELPLLLEYTVPTRGGVRPQLYVGPALAVRTGCRVGFRIAGGGESFSESSGCDGDDDEAAGLETAGPRRFDVAAVVGGALAFRAGGQTLTVGARYTHGFFELSDESGLRNRAVAVHAGFEFPVARRPR